MGRSKFPGKPSKLANKKRVSVLNNMFGVDGQAPAAGSSGGSCNSPSRTQGDPPPPDDDSDYAAGILSPSQSQDQNSMESSASGCTDSTTTTTVTSTTSSSTEKKAADCSSTSSDSNSGTSFDGAGTNEGEDSQVKTEEKPNPPDPPDPTGSTSSTNAMDSAAAGILTRARTKVPVEQIPDTNTPKPLLTKPKKKTVTFKAILETSDDVNIIKRVYNPDIVPAVPIIKISKSYDMLSRSERFARGDIVMPSRLTEVLKNLSANLDIDKLNQLTFKSANTPIDSEDVDTQDGEDQRSTNDSPLNACDKEAGADKSTLNLGGDKKFVLPRRSAHSCRVIKPNKRFLDDGVPSMIGKLGRRASCSGKLQHTADNFINNTLSSQINNSKLSEIDEWASGEGGKEGDKEDKDCQDQSKNIHAPKNKFAPAPKSNLFSNLPSAFTSKPLNTLASSKLILRQPRLTFQSAINDGDATTEGPFSTNLNSIKSTVQKPTNNVCIVCLSPTQKCHQMTRKFGFDSCETCRKFLTKIIKNINTTNDMHCTRGNCEIGPIPLEKSSHSKMFRSLIKERCSSCWLQKCLKVCPDLKAKIPTTNVYPLSASSPSNVIPSPFRVKTEQSDEQSSTNIFANNSGGAGKLLSWPINETNTLVNDTDYRPKISISNALVENNSTFGSSPLVKPMITEKPLIMTNSVSKETVNVKTAKTTPNPTTNSVITESKQCKEAPEEISRLRLRKKENTHISLPTSTVSTSNASDVVSLNNTATQVPLIAADTAKRQRIDLKGPRVKHVCRSASIVLGQTLATFPPDEASVLENMDTPPRPDSPNSPSNEVQTDISSETHIHPVENQSPCSECKPISPLSPPTTPITLQNAEDLELSNQANNSESIPEDDKSIEHSISNEITDKSIDDTSKPVGEPLKPFTRKLSRPIALSSNKVPHNITHHKKLNSFIRPTLLSTANSKSVVPKPALIDLDFWENYDPAEVSQSGFGLIVTESLTLRALCFLCGSSGQDPLMFCVCCCEPYHKYCVEDEYNLKSHSMDETNLSALEVTMLSEQSTRLNWLCPRCTVCYSCNMASGSKVKCQKCQKNYHSTCLGTSKRLSGADRPLICAGCLKCKSCGTTNVSKFVGNLPMCSPCFRLRQKGNFCPLCQKCYEDNDFNIKMMECGDCCRWVHAKCEGLTDEQYNMLSVLPENIEFVCRKCAQNNSSADTWREAVVAEFRAGLLSVVRLLSKSRQACALLKLSPRKKSSGSCVCQPVISNRTIMFNESNDDDSDSGVQQNKYDRQVNKCFCGASQPPVTQHITNMTLLEIKQKVQTNEYFSLADFNYDMNLITQAAACDELTVAYKEILSETFPWFQNETKACTDALEEDMYDSSHYDDGQVTAVEYDQQVPGIVGIPADSDDYFYDAYDTQDSRACLFCKGVGEGGSSNESRLLYCGQNGWVHTNCAMWSAEVFEEIDGSLQNVHSAISRGRLIKCSHCGSKGATVGCNLRNCGEHYHYPCAVISGCAFMMDKTVYCPSHINEADRQSCARETNFEVIRPVYVELDRKKKKCVPPGVVQFVIGSLQVKQLGKVVTKLSDHSEHVVVPADFRCTRLYWSTKEPWKIVEYSVRTFVQNNNQIMYQDLSKNMVVDHSRKDVYKRLAQISKWHKSLVGGSPMDEYCTDSLASSDETNEDEPQNNANDLLPPEIKDAIFEDLPHDILDGISMLDIFPMDSRNEQYLNSSDMSEMDDDFCDSSTKDYFGSSSGVDSWGHVEDALLSAAATSRTSISSRELKRSKSEIFAAAARNGSITSKTNHRSSSFSWNTKLDSSSITAKRRKVSRLDLRIGEGMLFSLANRPKLEMSATMSERGISSSADEKNRNTLHWSSSKKSTLVDDASVDSLVSRNKMDKLKISQLDGVDDLSSGSESGSPLHESINMSYDHSNRESPVKCERCHCTYRTYDSYHRHLPTCEPLSTSESESEHTTHASDMQSPPQNMIISSMSGPEFCNIPIMQQQQNQIQQPQQHIFNLNGQQISLQNIPSSQPMQINQTLPTNGSTMQSQTIHNLQNQLHNVILNPTNGQPHIFATSSLQPQIFPIQNLNQTHFTAQDFQKCATQPHSINLPNGISIQAATQPSMIQGQTQPQILNMTQPGTNGTHLLQIAPNPVQNISGFSSSSSTSTTTSSSINRSSTLKKQLILPQPTDRSVKRPLVQKAVTSGRGFSVKRPTKPVQIKQNTLKTTEHHVQQQQQQPQQPQAPQTIHPLKSMHMFNNQTIPIMRTTPGQNEMVLQQATGIGTQPMMVQQLGGTTTSNLVQYIGDNGQIQYIALPAQQTDFKQPQQPAQQPFAMAASNPIIQGGYQLTTDASGNLILANNTAPTLQGLQMLPNGTLQLTAQPQQPQVIGTIIQNQPNGMMMSADQLGFSNPPTLEMITNPTTGGCMLVTTNQPMYYGLETIVQNTVMSSQQFVSSAMQGVLSQNSSFSATTTQVFQASKIEPIMEMPSGYVVLNNDGTIMQPQPHQNIMTAGVQMAQSVPQMQTTLPPIQNQAQTISTINANGTQSWRFVDDKSSIQLLPQHQNQSHTQTSTQPPTHNMQPHQSLPQQTNVPVNIQPIKSVNKSTPIVVKKMQPQPAQYAKSIHPTSSSSLLDPLKQNTVILPKTMQSIAGIDGQPHYIIQNQQQQPVGTPPTTHNQYKTSGITVHPIQRKTNLIRPIAATAKVTNAVTVKPKVAPRLSTKVQSVKSHSKAATITSKPAHSFNIQHVQSTTQLTPAEQNMVTQKKPDLPCVLNADHITEFKGRTSFSVTPSMNDTSKVNTYTLSFTTTDPSCSTNGDTNNANTPTISCRILSSGPTSSSSGSFNQAQPFYSSATTHATITPPSSQFSAQSFTTNHPPTPPTTIISLPTASIQLPTAPYAPSYSNGLPTNVVNPIQQPQQQPFSSGYTSNVSISTPTISRPTNRVLPMQTQQPPKIPIQPTPTDVEPKMVDTIPIKKPITVDTSSPKITNVIEQDHSPNQLVIVEEKPEDEPDQDDQAACTIEMDPPAAINMEMDIDEVNQKLNHSKSTTLKEIEPPVTSDELFDKLKSETKDLLVRSFPSESKKDIENNKSNPSCSGISVSQTASEFKQENTVQPDTTNIDLESTSNAGETKPVFETSITIDPSTTIFGGDHHEQKENFNPTNVANESSTSLKRPLKCMLQEQQPTQPQQPSTPLQPPQKPTGPKMLYEIQSQDGFTYKSTSVTEIWEKVFEAVQVTRKAHGLAPLPDGPLADMCGHQMLGLKTNALKYLVEQLPGVEKCVKYQPKYHKRTSNSSGTNEQAFSSYCSDSEELVENPFGAARVEGYSSRSEYDMFSWLASRHRKQPNVVVVAPNSDIELIPRRGTGSNLPMAMRYRTLKDTYKETVGVYRSHIHGRGLFCNRDIEAGEMVIEYAGELIRSTLTDKRERYYDGRGIGCYMFKIDENLVVDATMRGNAARFINHACEPNCYSKVVDILGHKHIIIFALRRIVQGEELTYDYKFPFEETKIPCSCGSRKCRKYLN